MNKYGAFQLGEVTSERLGIILTEPPQMVVAEREVENIGIPGRSGDLTIDKGRYRNVRIPYRCAIIPKEGEELRQAITCALPMIRKSTGYARLENSFHESTYRLARIVNGVTVDSLVEKAGRFTLEFDCKPQRYLKSGDFAFEFCEASWIVNPTQEIAQPLITVYGSGPGELSIGGTTVQILALQDQITLDSEIMNAYRQVGDSPAESRNSDIYAPEFPTLAPGVNHFSWSGGIERIRIVPRWWTL